jgi:hypothetical protein
MCVSVVWSLRESLLLASSKLKKVLNVLIQKSG